MPSQLLWSHLQKALPESKWASERGLQMKLSAVSSSTFFLINLSDMRLPERARMLNSQTSIIFFYLDQIRKMGGGMQWQKVMGCRVDRGVNCEKHPLQGNQDLCSPFS